MLVKTCVEVEQDLDGLFKMREQMSILELKNLDTESHPSPYPPADHCDQDIVDNRMVSRIRKNCVHVAALRVFVCKLWSARLYHVSKEVELLQEHPALRRKSDRSVGMARYRGQK